jgi:hypothetical protein
LDNLSPQEKNKASFCYDAVFSAATSWLLLIKKGLFIALNNGVLSATFFAEIGRIIAIAYVCVYMVTYFPNLQLKF